ncbi:hypothetical protein ACH5RR_022851 [Cinchona calisaya]|uniref:Uncharacterized protein n=1 Tax=Cinchona calisaya TaxID=153742 RepID=A0ABD2ZAI8_9GENT
MRNLNEREQEEMKCYDIWVMREYNVTKSWTKQYTIETNSLIKKVLGFTQGGKLILRMDNNMLASWDPKDQQFEDLGINGELYHVDTGFTESLILLDNRKTVVPWKVM